MTQLTITLSFLRPEEIQADCSLVSRQPFACDVSFSLAASLQIGPARLEGEPCPARPLEAPRYGSVFLGARAGAGWNFPMGAA